MRPDLASCYPHPVASHDAMPWGVSALSTRLLTAMHNCSKDLGGVPRIAFAVESS